MKLLYLTKSFAVKAGVERVLSDKMNWLAEHGYDILFVTYEQGNHSKAFDLHPSIRHADIDARFFKLAFMPIYKRCFCYFRLRKRFRLNFQKVVDEFCPDIIITTTYQLKVLDLITSVNSDAKKVIESHIACYKAKKSGDFSKNSLRHYFAVCYDFYFLNRIAVFDKLVALTVGDANDWKRYNQNVKIIPNPITFYPDEVNLKQIKDTHRIIAVGRLDEQKGFDLLIEAFSKIAHLCPEWKIDIFGDGADKYLLLKLVSQFQLEGRVCINPPTADIYTEYMKSEFLVLSSRYEGYALVLNEAMSCSLPCVAFKCKYGPEDAITDKENGLLVSNGDTAELADAILWFIEHEEERVRMGENARVASARYKKDVIMKQWERLFESLL